MEQAAATTTFSGRAVSREMGQVRLGGSGRPVAISARAHDGDGTERREPRVVLEPQPRSPFGRKMETATGGVPWDFVGPHQHRSRTHKGARAPPQRVHTTHHPTHRTPVAVALRRTDAAAAAPAGSRKRVALSDTETTTDRVPTTARASKVAKNADGEAASQTTANPVQPNMATSIRPDDPTPDHFKLFTRKPIPTNFYQSGRNGFHIHERLVHLVADGGSRLGGDLNETADEVSGWRAVDDSIDHIYEDPSIDAVQQQLLLHATVRSGEKRKAVERERLQAAAAEVQKKREVHNLKLVEFQHRREQIVKMSNDIRARNKASLHQAPVISTKLLSTSESKKNMVTSAQPPRKPPVPRLSQLGGKGGSRKPTKVKNTSDSRSQSDLLDGGEKASSGVKEMGAANEACDGEDDNERHLNNASGSILLNHEQSQQTDQPTKTVREFKKRKPAKRKVPPALPDTQSSPPAEEKQQRRAVAREFMHIQKQTRRLMQAKLSEQRRLEEERRRLELQRLEKTRLLELEEARKRRIRQKQRERTVQRRRDEQERQSRQGGVFSSHSTSPVHKGSTAHNEEADHRGTENDGFRGNRALKDTSAEDPFEWPDGAHDSSGASTPRVLQKSVGTHEDPPSPAKGPKLQKLLALEEQTKILAQKLQLLSKQKSINESVGNARRVIADREDEINDDLEGARGSEVDRGSDRGSDSSAESEKSNSNVEGYFSDQHSATRIEQEDFIYFDGGFPVLNDLDVEVDLSSIGVQKLQMLWPHGGRSSDGDDDELPSARFEVLPSSSSSSDSSDQNNDSFNKRKRGMMGTTSEAVSPKLLEESVDAYAQRLFQLSVRAEDSSPSERQKPMNVVPKGQCEVSSCTSSPLSVCQKSSPPKRKVQKMASDAELLRLIRASDDNLSVIDREAKRRFRLQQDRLKTHQKNHELLEQERLKVMLHGHGDLPEPRGDMDIQTLDSRQHVEFAVPDSFGNVAAKGHIEGFQKLDQILEAVRTETNAEHDEYPPPPENNTQHDECPAPPKTNALHDGCPPPPDDRHATLNEQNMSVAFWNSQLRPLQTVSSEQAHETHHVEIDRSDINAQREYLLQLESEDDISDRPRLLSPQTLAKRLLAAVEYHEVIHDAHLQLSMMEKDHALEQVHQDTIALAQAFKEELDGNILAQQLVDEHATLEDEFDRNLKHVVDQLETVREAEQRESDRVRLQFEKEARAAKRRESAVQTETPLHVDATTSARLHIEAASSTDPERHDAAVQYIDDSPGIPPPIQIHTTEEKHDPVVDYDDDTFETPCLSPTKLSQSVEKAGEEASSGECKDSSLLEEALSVHEESRSAVDEARVVDNDEIGSDVDVEDEEEQPSESIQSESNELDSAEDEDDMGSAVNSTQRQSISLSVAYDDDDFEEETSLASPKVKRGSDNVEVSSDDDVHESEQASASASKAQSESSVGYEEETFERELSIDQDRKPTDPLSSKIPLKEDDTDKISEAAVSSDYSDDHEDALQDADADSVSDDLSSNRSEASDDVTPAQKVGIPAASCPSEQISQLKFAGHPQGANAGDLAAAPTISVTIDAPRIAEAVQMDPEIAQSYLQQLENRKRSEEALLDIRLRALESKLQQDLQSVTKAIKEHECATGDSRDERIRRELELRKDAMQMVYLSEKANIESMKSSCVSRYYQDLLAFRSLGATNIVAPTLGSTPFQQSSSFPTTNNSITLPGKVAASTRAEISAKDDDYTTAPYDDDEFVNSPAHSETSMAESQTVTIQEDKANRDSNELDSISGDGVEEGGEEIYSEHSTAVEEDPEDSISSASENEKEDYGDEDFASVSQSVNMEKDHGDDAEAAIEISLSIVDEPPSAVEAEADVVSDAYDDEFAATSAEEQSNHLHEHNEVVTAPSVEDLDGPEVVEPSEPDSTSQVYEDEFASVSESALNDAVSEEDLEKLDDVEDGSDYKNAKPDSSAVDDEYEKEFISVSETAVALKEYADMSEGDIEEDSIHSKHTPEEFKDEKDNGDEDYGSEDFEVPEAPTASEGGATTPNDTTPDAGAVEEDEVDEQYSQEDFEESDGKVSASSSASGPKTSGFNSSELITAAIESDNVKSLSDTSIVLADVWPTSEASSVRSVSASDFTLPNNNQTTIPEIGELPTALAESISISHQDEDLTTASMEEHLKRIDDLKHQLDLRRAAFTMVQKKLRVEKKKEHLREAETQLWVEMEQLESQLEADERILELTRQRGRLASMELEAKHQTLQLRDRELPDLLAEYDYTESVEPVKPDVTKQDQEAQVRLVDQASLFQSPRVHLVHAAGHGDDDLLLAFDHVEPAERLVTTIATNTDVIVQQDHQHQVTAVMQTQHLSVNDTDIIGKLENDQFSLSTLQLSSIVSDASPPGVTARRDRLAVEHDSKEMAATDLLEGYDHVEVVEEANMDLDLLYGYDHVEDVDVNSVSAKKESSVDLEHMVLETSDDIFVGKAVSPHEASGDTDKGADVGDRSSVLGSLKPGEDDDKQPEKMSRERNGSTDHLSDDTYSTAATLVDTTPEYAAHGHEACSDDQSENVDEDRRSSTHDADDVEEESKSTEDTLDREPLSSENEDKRVHFVTENLFSGLLHESVIEMLSGSARKAGRAHVCAANDLDDGRAVHLSQMDTQLTIVECDKATIGAATKEADDEISSQARNAVGRGTNSFHNDDREDESEQASLLETAAQERCTSAEKQIDSIADQLFAEMIATAIQDGIKLQQRQFRALEPRAPIQLPSESQAHDVPDKSSRMASIHPDRAIENAILSRLRIDSDQVVVPSFFECMPTERGTNDARAIYDAVVELAPSIYRQLYQDPLFRDEQGPQKKHDMLIGRLKHKMEDSIWSVRNRARDELDRFGRKILEDERGELDLDDLRLLLAHQRGGSSGALISRFKAIALRSQLSPAPGDVITPRLRRRGSSLSSVRASQLGLAAHILHDEEAQLADRITERLMRDLVRGATAEQRTQANVER